MQDGVSIAYGVLLEYDEVQDYINSGMSVQYTGETEVIGVNRAWCSPSAQTATISSFSARDTKI